MIEIIKILIPTILAGIFGFLIGIFNKKKERDFELAKIKATIYNELFESLRPALYSDYLDQRTVKEEVERFKYWQTALMKSDKLWLYGDNNVLISFKRLFDEYHNGNKDGYNIALESFINECRKDVLNSLGQKYKNESYKFITYTLDQKLLPKDFNRLKK